MPSPSSASGAASASPARRSFTSYAKARYWIARLRRNRRWQLKSERVQRLRYADLGCGPNTHAEFINVDHAWQPGVDLCWDLARGLPFATGTLAGIYTEHCLEHFSLPVAAAILRECRRALAPGGVLRIVVPDGELYLRRYCARVDGADAPAFPYESCERVGDVHVPMVSVNRVFYQDRDSPAGHRAMFDYALLATLLRHSGFGTVSRRAFGVGADPHLLIDTAARAAESLYVEATVAPGAHA